MEKATVRRIDPFRHEDLAAGAIISHRPALLLLYLLDMVQDPFNTANNPNRAIITLVRTVVTTASLWTPKQRVVVDVMNVGDDFVGRNAW